MGDLVTTAFAVASRPPYHRRKPARDRLRLAFCRRLPCIVCGTHKYIEAAHVGPHALSQKADDANTLPICRWHHRDSDFSLHMLGPVRFQERHHLSFEMWLNELNEWYAREVKR